MSKQKASECDIHVFTTTHYSATERDRTLYSISLFGNGMPEELTGEECLELARCLTRAVELEEGKRKEGGEK